MNGRPVVGRIKDGKGKMTRRPGAACQPWLFVRGWPAPWEVVFSAPMTIGRTRVSILKAGRVGNSPRPSRLAFGSMGVRHFGGASFSCIPLQDRRERPLSGLPSTGDDPPIHDHASKTTTPCVSRMSPGQTLPLWLPSSPNLPPLSVQNLTTSSGTHSGEPEDSDSRMTEAHPGFPEDGGSH